MSGGPRSAAVTRTSTRTCGLRCLGGLIGQPAAVLPSALGWRLPCRAAVNLLPVDAAPLEGGDQSLKGYIEQELAIVETLHEQENQVDRTFAFERIGQARAHKLHREQKYTVDDDDRPVAGEQGGQQRQVDYGG